MEKKEFHIVAETGIQRTSSYFISTNLQANLTQILT